MIVLRAFKTELDLNNTQKTACARHAGVAVMPTTGDWPTSRKPTSGRENAYQQSTCTANSIFEKDRTSWMYEVSKCAPQEALRDLDRPLRISFGG